jgi:hypothetical protein
MMASIASLFAILTALLTLVSFMIKAVTGRPAEEVINEEIRRLRNRPQPGTPPAHQGPSVVVARRPLRRLIPHPWLLGVSLLGLLLLIIPLASNQSDNPLIGVGTIVFIGAGIFGAVIAARGRHWVWFTAIILTFGYAVPFFSILARPKKQVTQPSRGPTDILSK